MRIGIDVRLWQETGVGRYTRALVENLSQIDKHNEYVVFLLSRDFENFRLPNERWHKTLADVQWHSVAEQLQMPGIYRGAKLDLLHIPYFSVPVMAPQPFIITLHDLTISHFATGKATTKPWLIYQLKRMGYQLVLKQAVKRADTIITVSESVKKQLLKEFAVAAEKVVVTYEAGTIETGTRLVHDFKHPYVLYVGNAHPHKNLERLLAAFSQLNKELPHLHLVLVGRPDYFYDRIAAKIDDLKLTQNVHLVGEVSNGDLATWYKEALAFVFPSRAEGFGIPGLEAMQFGTPVAAADIAVFHEIYGEAAVYFDPKSADDIKKQLLVLATDAKVREKLITKGFQKSQTYSWERMAAETLKIYENSPRIRPR